MFLCCSYCTSPRLHPKHEPRNGKPEEEKKGRRCRQSGTFPKTLPGTGSRLNSQMLSKRRDGEPILVDRGTLKTRRHPVTRLYELYQGNVERGQPPSTLHKTQARRKAELSQVACRLQVATWRYGNQQCVSMNLLVCFFAYEGLSKVLLGPNSGI